MKTLLSVVVVSVLAGCAYTKPACQVVDVAKVACDTLTVKYVGPDGVTRTQQVPKEELAAMAERTRLAKDGSIEDAIKDRK
jgi:hypothetical protein